MKSSSINWPVPATERRRFIAAGVGLALQAIAPGLQAQGSGMTPLAGRPPAPGLRLTDADDRLVDLVEYRGRVVLVNFWATWCPPCRKEFPSLGRVRKLFKPGEFEVLAVNVGEDPETVFSFTGNAAFPVLFDRHAKVMESWSVQGLPTSFLIDRQGRLAARAVGGREFDAPDIVAAIRPLLGKPHHPSEIKT